jgi:hypothetical protein
MLHALCVIALAVLISGGAVRLCSIFMKFGGFVMIVVRHVGFLKFSSQRRTIYQTLSRSRCHGMVLPGYSPFHLEARGISPRKQRIGPTSWPRTRPPRPSCLTAPCCAFGRIVRSLAISLGQKLSLLYLFLRASINSRQSYHRYLDPNFVGEGRGSSEVVRA